MNRYLAQLLTRLQYFESSALRLAPAAPGDWIQSCEEAIGQRFSPQMREFLLVHNGCRIAEVRLYGVPKQPRSSRGALNILTRCLDNQALDGWSRSWLELGSDGFGNYFAAELAKPNAAGEHPILWIDHEAIGRPHASKPLADDYFALIAHLIDEMMELYEPDGRLKRAV